MKTLIIAEKASVAKTLATHLSVNQREKGYFFNDTYIITYAIGHLVHLADPKTYTDNPWTMENLPIIPEDFQLVATPIASKKSQLNIIKKLVSKASYIINATDAAREGELIFRYIMSYCKATEKKVDRLWVSSYTKEELDNAFNSMKPQEDYQGLYHSALARNQADWLFGMNGTIALTKTLNSNQVLSLGRVQTPTYAMVCKRFLAHTNFVATPIFSLVLDLKHDNQAFEAVLDKKYQNDTQLIPILESLGNSIQCSSAKFKTSKVKPPKLFHLTELQKKANKIYKFSASKTLSIAQALYEKHKMLTYPRTDSKFLTKAMKSQMPEVLKSLKLLPGLVDCIAKINLNDLRDEPFDDSKVSDHFAIIPTGIIETNLQADEMLIFELVAKQFIAAFSDDALKASTTYEFKENQHLFKTSGVNYPELGWKAIFIADTDVSKNSQAPKQLLLPKIEENQQVSIFNKSIKESKTTAPKLLTEETLLGMMEHCGKEFENLEHKDLSKVGIGTPATRDSTIERIIEVGYIQRKGKQNYLVPTPLGLKLYQYIKSFSLANVTLTGQWENALYQIANDKVSYTDFMFHIKKNLNNQLLQEIAKLNGASISEKLNCPKCKNKSVVNQSAKFVCLTQECNFELWSNFFGIKLSNSKFKELTLLKPIAFKGLTNPKSNKKFDGQALLNLETLKLELQFNNTKKNSKLNCPKCQNGKLLIFDKFYGCENYKNGCQTSFPKQICGTNISLGLLNVLFKHKKTPVIKGFKSKKGKSFSAAFILTPDFKMQFEDSKK